MDPHVRLCVLVAADQGRLLEFGACLTLSCSASVFDSMTAQVDCPKPSSAWSTASPTSVSTIDGHEQEELQDHDIAETTDSVVQFALGSSGQGSLRSPVVDPSEGKVNHSSTDDQGSLSHNVDFDDIIAMPKPWLHEAFSTEKTRALMLDRLFEVRIH